MLRNKILAAELSFWTLSPITWLIMPNYLSMDYTHMHLISNNYTRASHSIFHKDFKNTNQNVIQWLIHQWNQFFTSKSGARSPTGSMDPSADHLNNLHTNLHINLHIIILLRTQATMITDFAKWKLIKFWNEINIFFIFFKVYQCPWGY